MIHPKILNPIELTGSLISRTLGTSMNDNPESNASLLTHAVDWAMEAGKIQIDKFRSRQLQIDTKSSLHDVVTEVDKACEKLIIDHIRQLYPTHSILSEECGELLQPDSEWEWVIDPLDGTNNYSQGLPIFCVSIGIKHRGVTQVGVVFVPYLDELYSAVRGQGANCNGRSLHVSRKKDLNECILATGFPYDKGTHPINNLDNVNALLPNLRGLRRMGSAAYDLCSVAAGWLDGYWEVNIKEWDGCAGSLIVEEAGGIVRPFRNDRNVSIVAGHKEVVEMIYPLLNSNI